jgi:hypothetical protein
MSRYFKRSGRAGELAADKRLLTHRMIHSQPVDAPGMDSDMVKKSGFEQMRSVPGKIVPGGRTGLLGGKRRRGLDQQPENAASPDD